MTSGQLLSLGSINLDLQVRAQRWPGPGETLPSEQFRMLGGGKAANVAYLACRLGVPVQLLGHVGDDVLAKHALRSLHDSAVDLRTVKAVPGAATGIAFVVVRPDGQKSIVLAGNANEAWSMQDAEAAASAVSNARDGSVLVADLEVPGFVVRRAIEVARQRGHRTLVDPSPADRFEADLYELVDVLTPNPAEAEQLSGVKVRAADAAAEAGRRLIDRGIDMALVKLETGGCVLVDAERTLHFPPPEVQVVDKTGAGDAFAGALGVALVEGQSPPMAARFAVTAAALAVTGYGSQPAYPSREQLQQMLRS